MAEPLDPTGGMVVLGDLVLRTQNLAGEAAAVEPMLSEGMRAADGAPSPLEAAFAAAGMTTTHVVELNATEIPGMAAAPSRGGGASASASIALDVPLPPTGTEQAVVSIDERGVTTWSFAEGRGGTGALRDAQATRTFVVRRPAAPRGMSAETADRGLGDIGKQIIKVVSFPIGKAIGRVLDSFIEDWETTHQGYGVRDYRLDNYQEQAPYFDGEPAKWQHLAKGRTLLMIHGTFSRAKGAFNELPRGHMAQLERLYEGRVIAFDHLTISQDPMENMDWLVRTIPEGTSLDVDIVCHSRGGLVARSLTEWTGSFPGQRDIRVHRTALVGTTNNGTILADVHHWRELVDTLSTVMNTVGLNLPAPAELVLAFVKDIAEAGYPELRGLACMVPDGPFLAKFNARTSRGSEYLAIASNFEPVDGRLQSYFSDAITDFIFDQNQNDCLVRVDSVVGSQAKGAFPPVAETLQLGATKGIEHSRYFGSGEVADRLLGWLGAGLAVHA